MNEQEEKEFEDFMKVIEFQADVRECLNNLEKAIQDHHEYIEDIGYKNFPTIDYESMASNMEAISQASAKYLREAAKYLYSLYETEQSLLP